ncbi:MAG: 4-hydroxyphenylacetate 3-hydroxylase family protein [Smithellaceae bacterium]|nr:4-hydroxyphenylacetate 3-hydroxylase family protein [Smithellaceae bacterium]
MMKADEYLESLKKLKKRKIYLGGKLLDDPVDHPIIRPSINSVALTYRLAEEDEYAPLMTATSALTGRRVNRFIHLHQDTEDLVKKIKMQRLLGQLTGSCFQRCVGWDALNALWSTTHELDQQYGTAYHERLKAYLAEWEEKDWTVAGSMTDPKGNRRLAPSAQADPDLYLHLVERRSDGMVVRGAKVHQTGILNAHEILVMPTLALRAEDRDYAVSFAVPSDAEGLIYIYGRQSCDTRKLEPTLTDVGNINYGGQEAVVIFNDVLIPWERVFMCGEWDFASTLVERFSGYHRQSYGGCKAGMGDVLIGAASSLAGYHGLGKASHIREKLTEMIHLNETLYSCGIACSALGRPTPAGNFLIDLLLANVCKLNVTRFPYEIARLAHDIAGGLLVTLPSDEDFQSPAVGALLEKYLAGDGTTCQTRERQKMLRLVEAMTMGATAACYLAESMHGAGSPQAQRIMIQRLSDLSGKEALARHLAGIEE